MKKTSRIRSFVCRGGRLSFRQRQAFEKGWGHFAMPLSDGLTLHDIFTEGPVTLEIGFGMGTSLLQMALAEPSMNFLGIEMHRPGIASLLAGIEEHQLSNIRILYADAVDVVQTVIPPSSLDRVFIFFPDPWPKTRHHKRRLVQVEWVEQLRVCLKTGGLLHMATDFEPYAEQMQQVVGQVGGFLRLPGEMAASRPKTKFEQRGVKLGHVIFDLVWRRVSSVDSL